VDFEFAQPGRVVLDVFDTEGRMVNRIADELFTAGRHVSVWRGDDADGHALGAGVYFIRMQARAFRATRRTVRVR
jgi:flagellar hook assembly protein FlgD